MGRIEVALEEDGGGLPQSSMKDDSRQSENDTENNCSSGDDDVVRELRAQLRERDSQLASLRDDKDVCTKQILDLKDQLYQLVSYGYLL